MRKNIYEIVDELKLATTNQQKLNILSANWNHTLSLVLQFTYHPNLKWKYKKMPEKYKKPDTVPGISYSNLDIELRRLYLFMEGHPTAEKLTPEKSEELLVTMLETLEPKEAEIIIAIFNKDLGVKGMNTKFIQDNIPGIIV